MKAIVLIALGVLSMTLFSFKGAGEDISGGKVTKLKNGNYMATPGAISRADAQVLVSLSSISAGETTVVHQTIWKHKDVAKLEAGATTVIHQTIWKHKDAAKLESTHRAVNCILEKYL